MPTAKDIRVAPIASGPANEFVRRVHYSGKVVRNSQLHLGVFLDGSLEGVMQFGPPTDRGKVIGLVRDTKWNDMMELNRMAFSERLPRNSESRALGIALRMLRRQCPTMEWILSFADGTQCGDGTIYRAAGFVLTQINKNKTIVRLPDGTIASQTTFSTKAHKNGGRAAPPKGSTALPGWQLRYIYFLNPAARERLTCPIIPFSEIEARGVGMYRGVARGKQAMAGVHLAQRQGSVDHHAPNSEAMTDG